MAYEIDILMKWFRREHTNTNKRYYNDDTKQLIKNGVILAPKVLALTEQLRTLTEKYKELKLVSTKDQKVLDEAFTDLAKLFDLAIDRKHFDQALPGNFDRKFNIAMVYKLYLIFVEYFWSTNMRNIHKKLRESHTKQHFKLVTRYNRFAPYAYGGFYVG